jgi:hypothetical protein
MAACEVTYDLTRKSPAGVCPTTVYILIYNKATFGLDHTISKSSIFRVFNITISHGLYNNGCRHSQCATQ